MKAARRRVLVAAEGARELDALTGELGELSAHLVETRCPLSARALLSAERVAGGLFTAHTDHAASLEVLAELRAADRALPALVVGPPPGADLALRVDRLDAAYLVREGAWRDEVRHFVRRVVRAAPVALDDRLAHASAALAHELGLSPREAEMLHLLASDVDRSALADEMAISPNTLKAHARSVLHKARRSPAADLHGRVLGLAELAAHVRRRARSE